MSDSEEDFNADDEFNCSAQGLELKSIPPGTNITKENIDDAIVILRFIFGKASSFMHNGSWKYTGKNGMKEYLVDGGHGMHKPADRDGVKNWVAEQKIKGDITMVQSRELITMFWNKDSVTTLAGKLREKKVHPDKKWYLLLLGSPNPQGAKNENLKSVETGTDEDQDSINIELK